MLAQRTVGCKVSLGQAEWEISLAPLGRAVGDGVAGWRIDVQWAGAELTLRLPAAVATIWLKARFPQIDLPSLPAAFAAAALEDALAEVLAAIERLGRGAAQIGRIVTTGTDEGKPPPKHRFALTMRCGESVFHASLAADALGLMLLAGLVAQVPPVTNGLDADSLPILLRAEIGRSRLSAEAVTGLTIRDTIRIEHAWISQGGELWLGQGSFGVGARLDDTQLTITRAFGTIPIMSTPEFTENNNAEALPVEHIPLQLAFDLGERTLTLGELKALQPGQVLDLGRPLSSCVNIRVNGALIGTGELVEVDGSLGITIATLAEKRS